MIHSKTPHHSWPLMLALLVLASGIMTTGCSKTTLSSTWRDRDITIDGDPTEWEEVRAPLEEEPLILGLCNDDKHLYVTMTPRDDATQRQIMMRGLTIWFDPEGGKEHALGVHFPLGVQGERMWDMWRAQRAQEPEPDPDQPPEQFASSLAEFEVLGPATGESQRLPVGEATGSDFDIEVGARLMGNVLVYELRVPLQRTTTCRHGIGVLEGEKLGVGIETPALDRQAMKPRTGGGMGRPPGGGTGRSGGGMGRGGGPGGGMRPEMPERLEFWTKVELADAAAGEPSGTPAEGSHRLDDVRLPVLPAR